LNEVIVFSMCVTRSATGGAGRPQVRFAATEAARAFALDQRLERLVDHAGFLLESGQGLSLSHQFVIKRHRRAHPSTSNTDANFIII
jgi:predicted ArsR family transcriptional regulator